MIEKRATELGASDEIYKCNKCSNISFNTLRERIDCRLAILKNTLSELKLEGEKKKIEMLEIEQEIGKGDKFKRLEQIMLRNNATSEQYYGGIHTGTLLQLFN